MADERRLRKAQLRQLLQTIDARRHSSSAGRIEKRKWVACKDNGTMREGTEEENALQDFSLSLLSSRCFFSRVSVLLTLW